jgi:hypothetical protein
MRLTNMDGARGRGALRAGCFGGSPVSPPACCASSAHVDSAAAVVNALQPEDAGDAHPVHYFSTSDQTPFQLVRGAVVRN